MAEDTSDLGHNSLRLPSGILFFFFGDYYFYRIVLPSMTPVCVVFCFYFNFIFLRQGVSI